MPTEWTAKPTHAQRHGLVDGPTDVGHQTHVIVKRYKDPAEDEVRITREEAIDYLKDWYRNPAELVDMILTGEVPSVQTPYAWYARN